MTPLTHKTAVVVIPPDDLWPPIQEIRRKYDRHHPRWMPHITLLYPFLPREEFHSLLSLYEDACRKISPFTITFSSARFFRHRRDKYTFWLDPDPAEALRTLREKLLAATPECVDMNQHSSGFTPHLSLGQADGQRQLEERIQSIQSILPLQFKCRNVCLIAREDPPEDIFKTLYSCGFGRE